MLQDHVDPAPSPPRRPEVIELTFPRVAALRNWNVQSGKPFRTSALWLFDGSVYRLPGTPFRLAHVPSSSVAAAAGGSAPSNNNSSHGRWCIGQRQPQPNTGVFSASEVPAMASPAESLPYSQWMVQLGDEAWALGPVSCHAIQAENVCDAIEAFVTSGRFTLEDDNQERTMELEWLVWETLNHCQGRVVLPWLLRSLPQLAQWANAALELDRMEQLELVAQLLNTSLISRLIPRQVQPYCDSDSDSDPLSASAPGSEMLAKALLSPHRDWSDHRKTQSIAMSALAWLCVRDTAWRDLILNIAAPPRVNFLGFLIATAADTTVERGSYELLVQLLSVPSDDPDVAAPDATFAEAEPDLRRLSRSISLAIDGGDSSAWTVDLAETLGKHEQTREMFYEEQESAIEPEWWTNLTEAQREMLNVEANDRFKCIITGEVMRNPVVLEASGEIYERHGIRTWLRGRNNQRDPRTNEPVGDNTRLVPNAPLRREIRSWCEDRVRLN